MTVPRVYVTTDDGNGNTIEKADGYVGANIKIEDVDGSVLEDKASFKVRGNSTALAEKKPFTFKFSKKKDVLGMGKGKKWALLANCFDPTLMRNYIAFDIAHELGIDYTSNQKYVELWVDGVFKGCYTLMEPVQQGKDRVDIDIESNNGMKDFLIEYEYNREEEGVTYIKSNGYRFALSEPEEPTAEQLEYIQEKVDIMTAAMVSKNYDRITEVQKICADIITADGRTKAAADINGDGVIDVTEATKIQQNLAEIFTDGYEEHRKNIPFFSFVKISKFLLRYLYFCGMIKP